MIRHRLALSLVAALCPMFTTTGCTRPPERAGELATASAAGVRLLESGQLPEAEVEFRTVVRLAPRDPRGHANLGLTYLRAGRYAEAERALRRARRLDPTSVDVALIIARLYSVTNRWDAARATLEALRRERPTSAQLLYALAELELRDSSDIAHDNYAQGLRQVLSVTPSNLAVRAKLIGALARRGEADSVRLHLETLDRIRPEPPAEARTPMAATLALLRAGRFTEARTTLDRFLRLLELTTPYQAALARVGWLEGPIVGRPVLAYKPESRLQNLRLIPTDRVAGRIRFTDVTQASGFPGPAADRQLGGPTALLMADFGGRGYDDLFLSIWSSDQQRVVSRLFRIFAGGADDVTPRAGLPPLLGATVAAAGDYDNDGWLDLFAIGADGRAHLLRNAGGTQLVSTNASFASADGTGAREALFVDLDHDGDLDLLLVGAARNQVYRNNADGTFTEVGAGMGLSGRGGGHAAGFADFDDDGHVDIIVATDHGPVLYRNTGARRFDDVTAASGLPLREATGAVTVGDYDNDGVFDLALLGPTGPPTLWRGAGDGTFARDRASGGPFGRVGAMTGGTARFADVDNDGWLDLIVVGTPPSADAAAAFLFRNDGAGRFTERSSALPTTLSSGRRIALGDIDGDGDVDLLIGTGTGVRVLRNDDGNANLSVSVTLFGLRAGSGKNNNFGIGARVELRAGEIRQTRTVTDRVTHFGLGPHLKADILRIQWPNGALQTVYIPGTDQDIMELDQLKGSCAFVYAWDGTGFHFVTDVMWRSALGMPVGIMGGGGSDAPEQAAYAPAGASKEYVRIPGSALKPRNGRYVIQLTEELWETAYADQLTLLAVDHPDSIDIFVDERFVPPAPVSLRIFNVAQPRAPRSAVDGHGNNVLPALLAADRTYVSQFASLAYQGLVEQHELIMDLGDDAGRAGTALFLRGWIYPADASINVALSQQSRISPAMPSLEVRDAAGRWVPAIPSISFPSGKDKTVIVDLAGIFPTHDRHVRIRTNMQVYWDHAFVAQHASASPVRTTPLEPIAADLHVRGYSRMYRAGGPYGPHWFDYSQVARESPWRTIEGAFTRVGDVLPLLRSSDDMYVIMAPGDEVTVEFDASSAAALPAGWTRDFLLYTDGWIKDADLNTAFGNTVGPLPFQAIARYPYAPGDAYPTDSVHQDYQRTYNTRVIRRSRPGAFRTP